MQKVCRALRPRLFSTCSSRLARFFDDPNEAVKDIPNGATILCGGFGLCGIAENCIRALNEKNTKDLTIATITSGVEDFGPGLLITARQVKRVITTYLGANPEAGRLFMKGELEVEFTPQGNLVEKIRAAGAGISAFYTPVGYGTLVQKGGIPIKFGPNGKPVMVSKEKSVREFNGHFYHLEEALHGDYAFIKAWKADRKGNLIFRKSARNINPTMAKAAKCTIAEVEEIVEEGEIDPDHIHLQHIFVHRVVKPKSFLKPIERIRHFTPKGKTRSSDDLLREKIARRAVLEIKQGMCVNLGIGLPVLCSNFLKPGSATFQSENGVLGLGPYPKPDEVDPDMTNAAKESSTVVKGASFFSTDATFDMIRGGHLDWTILGAMQVSQHGDLANWMIPDKLLLGMGGAMDLVSSFKTKVMITMEHTDKNGRSKLVDECKLPLTGKQVVDMVVTEMGVFTVDHKKGLTLTEIGEGFTVDQVKTATACPFRVSESLKPMAQAEELE